MIFIFAIILACATIKYLFRKPRVISYRLLVIGSIVFRIFHALILTIAQYYAWTGGNALTKSFLNFSLPTTLPIPATQYLPWFFDNRFGYFLFYSYDRFWLNVVVIIGVAYLFYFFLIALKKYRERFFIEGETQLGLLAALIVGWPNFVVFVPLIFLFVIFFSAIRRIVFKKIYTTIGFPLILAAAIMLAWGNQIIESLNITVLKI